MLPVLFENHVVFLLWLPPLGGHGDNSRQHMEFVGVPNTREASELQIFEHIAPGGQYHARYFNGLGKT